jgi:KDO2-lipid IV(A) lauroyltransferase
MSEAEVRKRFDLGNIDLITQQYALGKSVLNMTAHYGNWEWRSIFRSSFSDFSGKAFFKFSRVSFLR